MSKGPLPGIGRKWTAEELAAVGMYASTGNLSRAALACGLKRRQLVQRMQNDPGFAAEMADAHETYLDDLEESMATMVRGSGDGKKSGNPLPGFAIMKAHRSTKWTDKGQTIAVQVNTTTEKAPVTEDQLEKLFRRSWAGALVESRRALAGLPEGADDTTLEVAAEVVEEAGAPGAEAGTDVPAVRRVSTGVRSSSGAQS